MGWKAQVSNIWNDSIFVIKNFKDCQTECCRMNHSLNENVFHKLDQRFLNKTKFDLNKIIIIKMKWYFKVLVPNSNILLYPTQRVAEGIMFLTRPSVSQSVCQSVSQSVSPSVLFFLLAQLL